MMFGEVSLFVGVGVCMLCTHFATITLLFLFDGMMTEWMTLSNRTYR